MQDDAPTSNAAVREPRTRRRLHVNGEEVAVFFMAASGFKRMTEIIGELAEKSSPFSKNLIFSGGTTRTLIRSIGPH